MMPIPPENILAAATEHQAELVDFTQQLVATPSLPGQEQNIAQLIENRMNQLDFDEIWRDEAGNLIGKIKGGSGPAVILNGHMDHVDPGPPEGWPYPPFSAQIADGQLWGRASVDMKGAVACMIYATSLLKELGITPPGDIFMTVAVMEEVGGIGTQHLVNHLGAQAAICGEPSSNTLRRGHRGRVELQVDFAGRSAHASAPHLGTNPHYLAALFLSKLSTIKLGQNDTLGRSSVVPTLYTTDQTSANVIPGQITLTLDWRNVASESPPEIADKVTQLLNICLAQIGTDYPSGAQVRIVSNQFTTYTGLKIESPAIFPSFLLPEDHAFVQATHKALVNLLGRDDGVDIWRFATDGGHLMAAGIPTVGFGPGDETLAHTNQEHISLAQMEEAVAAYAALALALGQAAT